MIKHRYFAGRVLVYGLISVTVMLSAAMTGCNGGSTRIIFQKKVLRQKLSSQKEIISQKRAVSQMLMSSRQIFMLSHR